jgi:oligopeptide transport system substrate-binding protein
MPQHNVLYTAFTDRPKHLDPAQSYTEDEIDLHRRRSTSRRLQYHYLKRPYELIPATLEEVPRPRFFWMPKVAASCRPTRRLERIAESVYELRLKLKPGIRYQPHPAFAARRPTVSRFNLGKIEIAAEARSKIADFPAQREHAS